MLTSHLNVPLPLLFLYHDAFFLVTGHLLFNFPITDLKHPQLSSNSIPGTVQPDVPLLAH